MHSVHNLPHLPIAKTASSGQLSKKPVNTAVSKPCLSHLSEFFRPNATKEEIAQAQKVLDIRAAQATEKTAEGIAAQALKGIEIANFVLSSGLVAGAVASGGVIPLLTALFLAKDDIINPAGYV